MLIWLFKYPYFFRQIPLQHGVKCFWSTVVFVFLTLIKVWTETKMPATRVLPRFPLFWTEPDCLVLPPQEWLWGWGRLHRDFLKGPESSPVGPQDESSALPCPPLFHRPSVCQAPLLKSQKSSGSKMTVTTHLRILREEVWISKRWWLLILRRWMHLKRAIQMMKCIQVSHLETN